MQEVLEQIRKVASTDANVLLLGENGTGKYVLAESIHEQSERKTSRLSILTLKYFRKPF
jgi:DNA-binding NtrC family response regulator